MLNVEDTGGIDSETLPTFGLGLHKSNSSTSPGHIAHSPTGYSETDSSSPRSPTANPFYKQQQHMPPGADVSKENILHLLQAETITSVVNVQVAVGFKPALPWIAMDSRDRTKPWNKKEAVARMANEWQLILQLLTETDPLVNKANNNESSANISASPLV
ncbi:hypothetical protein G6F68_014448 [Rhizopus microsporus]|nr:hypothetical protein G6F68_014448 [Rhizopus microsporus]